MNKIIFVSIGCLFITALKDYYKESFYIHFIFNPLELFAFTIKKILLPNFILLILENILEVRSIKIREERVSRYSVPTSTSLNKNLNLIYCTFGGGNSMSHFFQSGIIKTKFPRVRIESTTYIYS